MATVIAFASEKGGTGKTTSIEAVATHLHYTTDYKIALFDADANQTSAYKDRATHLHQLENMSDKVAYKQYYLENLKEKEMYPIVRATVDNFTSLLDKYEAEDVDIILVDMPGFINKTLLATVIPLTEYVFIPVHPDEKTVPSTIDFAIIIKQIEGNKQSHVKGIRLFFSKYSNSKLQTEFRETKAYIEEQTGVKFMESSFHEKTEVVKGNMSTLFPYKGAENPDHFLNTFVSEIIDVITQE